VVLSDWLGFLNAGTFALVTFWEYTHRLLFLHFLQHKGYLADDAHRPDDRKSAGAVSGGIAKYQRMRGKPAHKVVCDADLIVVGHRCIKHDDTDALRAVVEGTTLEERV
jgi:hypothetical protein